MTYIKLFLVESKVKVMRKGECKEGRHVYGDEHSYFRIRMEPPQKLSYLNYLR